MKILADILIAEGGAGNLVFVLIMAAVAIASKIVAAKREQDKARQDSQSGPAPQSTLDDEDDQEVIDAADKLPGDVLPPHRPMPGQPRPVQRLQMPQQNARLQIVTQQQHNAPMPQRRAEVVDITGATRQTINRPEIVDATGSRNQMGQTNRRPGIAEVTGATGQMIRRPDGTAAQTPVPVRQQVRQVAKPVVVGKTMDMRVEEELQRQRRRMEQEEAQRHKRMNTQAPSESKIETIETRILHIRKPDTTGQIASSGPTVRVNLLSTDNARHAMLLYEIFAPCKALREEADLPGLR